MFEQFLLISKSWGEIINLKNIFGIVLLEFIHVLHTLKRDCDFDRATDIILKKAKIEKYANLSLVIWKKSESSWL